MKPLVCINKYDINRENSREIEGYCLNQGIKVAGRIDFDDAVTESIVRGLPVVEYTRGRVARQIEALWEETEKWLKE